DPIYALIAEHREAMRAESAAYSAQSRAEKAIPLKLRSWSHSAGDEGPPEGCTDPPEWIESEMMVVRACNRARDAEYAVLASHRPRWPALQRCFITSDCRTSRATRAGTATPQSWQMPACAASMISGLLRLTSPA